MTNDEQGGAPTWLIPDRLYDILKWLACLVLPAIALAVESIGTAWGWPHLTAIVTTITAIATLCGAIIGISAINGPKDGSGTDTLNG